MSDMLSWFILFKYAVCLDTGQVYDPYSPYGDRRDVDRARMKGYGSGYKSDGPGPDWDRRSREKV